MVMAQVGSQGVSLSGGGMAMLEEVSHWGQVLWLEQLKPGSVSL